MSEEIMHHATKGEILTALKGEIIDAENFLARNIKNKPLLGLDLGTKTIGLALSDIGYSIASSYMTLERKKFGLDVAALKAVIEKHHIAALVIGLPLNMDGSEGPRTQSTRSFVRLMLPLINIPVLYWDERLSTVAANRVLIEADISRSKRASVIDSAAACYILQGFLDRLRMLRQQESEF